jgi:hypothetical protein
MANPCDFYINGKKMKMDEFLSYAKKLPHTQLNDILGGIPSFKNIPEAPFVTDTNAWTKLGLKVALKEAVKQGATKIAWTTGEQQNDRYDLSTKVDEVWYKNGRLVVTDKNGAEVVDRKNVSENELSDIIGKEAAEKLVNQKEEDGAKILNNSDLKIGGKGMKGFYGSPTEGSLGIVGNVAKSLFKQEPKTIKIVERKKDFDGYVIDKNDDGTYNVGIKNEDLYGDPDNGFETHL